MTLQELRELTLDWQIKLRISEWAIHARWMTRAELKDSETKNHTCNGFTFWDEQHKTATLAVNRRFRNLPQIVVHELLHIRIEGHKPVKAGVDLPMEVAINALTEAYLG